MSDELLGAIGDELRAEYERLSARAAKNWAPNPPTLPEFLLARIAEDEEAAHIASEVWNAGMCDWVTGPPAEWVASNGYDSGRVERTNAPAGDSGVVVYDEGSPSEGEAAHIARHDPARVLLECEAKRRIVARHRPSGEYEPDACVVCQWDSDCEAPKQGHHYGAGEWPCPDMRDLASIYADHPDYQEAWKP